MSAGDVFRRCIEIADSGESGVLVTLVEVTGSAPQDTGAKMIVNSRGHAGGTVGGGRLEAKAINLAGRILTGDLERCVLVDWSLKADVGMTCGGRVKLFFEFFGSADWQIVMFGAGHVAQALAQLLVSLPCQVTCIDPRTEWLAKLPQKVVRVQLESPATFVDSIPNQVYVLCMTQGHHSDLPVLERLLSLDLSFPFVGVIGSEVKAAVLKKALIESGVDAARVEFHCPVGLPIGTNHPGEIAVSIAAQLLEVRDSMKAN